MRLKAIAGLLVFLPFLFPTGLFAQELEPGTRVRVTALSVSNQPIVGELRAIGNDSLTVRQQGTDARTRMALSSVSRIEVSRGLRSNTWRYATTGALVGGVAGLVIGILATDDVGGIAGATVGGGLVGGVGGGLLGRSQRSEDWTRVSIPSDARRGASQAGTGLRIPGPALTFSVPLF